MSTKTTEATIAHAGQTFTGTLTGDGGVVVRMGTVAAEITSDSPEIKSTQRLRDAMIAEKSLVKKGGKVVFAEDTLFANLTAAARIVCGTVVSGRAKWKPVG